MESNAQILCCQAFARSAGHADFGNSAVGFVRGVAA
jgi:hypothetical protein